VIMLRTNDVTPIRPDLGSVCSWEALHAAHRLSVGIMLWLPIRLTVASLVDCCKL